MRILNLHVPLKVGNINALKLQDNITDQKFITSTVIDTVGHIKQDNSIQANSFGNITCGISSRKHKW